MRSLALLEPSHPAMRQKDNLPALQDGEAEVERLIKQADELKAEKQPPHVRGCPDAAPGQLRCPHVLKAGHFAALAHRLPNVMRLNAYHAHHEPLEPHHGACIDTDAGITRVCTHGAD